MELLDLYFQKELPASRVSILMYWAWMGGLKECEPYALKPGSSSGHYQRRMSEGLGFDVLDKRLYELEVPVCSHLNDEREKQSIFVQPFHESLVREVNETPNIFIDWDATVGSASWVQSYEDHPFIANASRDQRKHTLVTSLYMDAAAFQKRDSLLVITAHVLSTGRRHLIAALRKSSFCQCGCGGWCTLYPVWVPEHRKK